MARRQDLFLFLKAAPRVFVAKISLLRLFIQPSIHYRLVFHFLDMDFVDAPRLSDVETSMSSDTPAAPGLEKDNTPETSAEVTATPGSSLQSTAEVDDSWEHQFLWVLGSI